MRVTYSTHALVQDAAHGTLLREPRRALHARIAETLEDQFAEIAENQPELLARHYTEAGLTEKAASRWGKAGQRSRERSALVEAMAQLTRALDQIATLPATPALRREQIKLSSSATPTCATRRGASCPAAVRRCMPFQVCCPCGHAGIATSLPRLLRWERLRAVRLFRAAEGRPIKAPAPRARQP